MKPFISALICALALPAAALGASDRMGVCAHTARPYENVIQDKMYDAMAEAGLRFMRLDVGWNELADGSFNYDVIDEICAKTAARGISILGIVGFGNGKRNAIDNPDEWARYVEHIARHFKGRIDHWEIINEHNLKKMGGASSGAVYGKILKSAYAAAKRGNSGAVVVYGGLAGVPEKYVEDSLKVAGVDSFDVMNYHTYIAPGACEPMLKKRNEILRALMKKYGGEKPIWLTEIGASTPDSFLDTEHIVRAAARYLKITKRAAYALDGVGREPARQLLAAFPKASKRGVITHAQIKDLPADAVLLIPISQAFDYSYSGDLADFVRRGGTMIYAGGGYPFWKNTSKTGAKNEVSPLRKLRVDMRPGWTYGKKIPSDIDRKNVVFEEGFGKLKKIADIPPFRSFNFLPTLLKEGDEFIPIASAKIGGIDFVPAAIYKFNSDYKGAVVMISTRGKKYVTLAEQADFLARDFLYGISSGIDKVFEYQLRAHGRINRFEGNLGILNQDLSRKPAFYAAKTLSGLLGNAVPKLDENAETGLCKAEWKSPKGENVVAVWSYKDKVKTSVKTGGDCKVFGVCGAEIAVGGDSPAVDKGGGELEILASGSPIYVVFK